MWKPMVTLKNISFWREPCWVVQAGLEHTVSPPASSSLVLGWQACTTTPNLKDIFTRVVDKLLMCKQDRA